MGSIRLYVEGLQGWEDLPRVRRILLDLPSVEEVVVDPATGQAWLRGRGQLPLLGALESLHRAGYEAEPAIEKDLFPTQARDERRALRRLRFALLWTVLLLAFGLLAPDGIWTLSAGIALSAAFLFTTARPLWIASLKMISRGRWGESPRLALALWLMIASLPWSTGAGWAASFAMTPVAASLLFLSRYLELRWRRSLRGEVREEGAAANLHAAMGSQAEDLDPLRRSGEILGWILPAMALLWLILGIFFLHKPSAAGLMRGMAAILLAGGSRGLILATPSVLAIGLARASSRGVVFRHASFFRRFHRADTLAFDRMGFLTHGQAKVDSAKIFGSESSDRLYAETAGVLAEAEHPLLKALHEFVAERSDDTSHPLSVIRHPGGGLEAEIGGRALLVGHPWFLEREGVDLLPAGEALSDCDERGLSVLALAEDGRLRAVFGLKVDPRPEAPSILRSLVTLGLSPLLLTGEREDLARRDAEALGIPQYRACLGSEERSKVLRSLAKEGRRLAALGQGSHDAPVLASAEFPVAMGETVSTERAGLMLRSGKPLALLDALGYSRFCDGLSRQNTWLARALLFLALLLAFAGLVGPMGAVALRVLGVQLPLLYSLRTRTFHFESSFTESSR